MCNARRMIHSFQLIQADAKSAGQEVLLEDPSAAVHLGTIEEEFVYKSITYCPLTRFRSAASSAARAPGSASTPTQCSPPPAPTSLARPCGQTMPTKARP